MASLRLRGCFRVVGASWSLTMRVEFFDMIQIPFEQFGYVLFRHPSL